MARTVGARNVDYAEQRQALARRVRPLVLAQGGVRASLRDMAAEAKVSVSALKHYFHDREGVMAAVMEVLRLDAAPYLLAASTPLAGDVRASLSDLLTQLREGWFRYGVGALQSSALAAGLSSSALGAPYVNFVLEPLLQTAESRLRLHVERGELAPCNVRFAALAFMSPVVLGLLHQDSLGGAACRPLDLDAFLSQHLDAFLRAYPVTAKGAATVTQVVRARPRGRGSRSA